MTLPLATTSDMEKRHMDLPAPIPVIYAVWRRDVLVSLYDSEAAAVQHGCAIEADEGASVRVDLWKIRQAFDPALYARQRAVSRMRPEARIKGLPDLPKVDAD